MTIKSSQTLVFEALREIKTISPEKALELSNDSKCHLIDIREIKDNSLERDLLLCINQEEVLENNENVI